MNSFILIVRLEMTNCRFTTTQDMFLERVGITNSFNDDNEYRYTPFFVSKHNQLINIFFRRSMVSNSLMSRRRNYISLSHLSIETLVLV